MKIVDMNQNNNNGVMVMTGFTKKLIVLLILGLCFLSVYGCKTIEGIGEDVENVGEAL